MEPVPLLTVPAACGLVNILDLSTGTAGDAGGATQCCRRGSRARCGRGSIKHFGVLLRVQRAVAEVIAAINVVLAIRP